MVIDKYTFLQISLGFAAVSWVAVAAKWKFLKFITKPATLIALMAFIWYLRSGILYGEEVNWLLLAIFFSLIGDLLLTLLRNSLGPALIAFLFAMLSYILSLLVALPAMNMASVIVAIIVGITIYQIYRRIIPGVQHSSETYIKVLMPLYAITLSIFVIFSLLTLASNGWENYRALLLSAGAILFLISNIWYAWHRFVQPLKWPHIRVLMTFHLGHCLLCLGFLITF